MRPHLHHLELGRTTPQNLRGAGLVLPFSYYGASPSAHSLVCFSEVAPLENSAELAAPRGRVGVRIGVRVTIKVRATRQPFHGIRIQASSSDLCGESTCDQLRGLPANFHSLIVLAGYKRLGAISRIRCNLLGPTVIPTAWVIRHRPASPRALTDICNIIEPCWRTTDLASVAESSASWKYFADDDFCTRAAPELVVNSVPHSINFE